VRSAESLGTTLISVTGGEPLLRPDLYELLHYIHERGLATHMCTNGVLLDRDNVLLLRDSGVDAVSVSIESTEREIHETLRGPGSFDRAVAGVRLLRELAPDIRIGINYLITTANFRNMAAMIPFAESLGVHQVKFAPIHTNLLHRRKRIESYGNLIFVEEDLEDLNREVRELVRVAARSKMQTTSTMFFSGITQLYSKPKRFRCYAGYAACAINPNGTVTPCCDMESALSVRDKPLEEIWRSPEFHGLRKKVERCDSSCWDTTNTELSLRLRPGALIIDALQTWRDVEFYFKDGSR
jgi:MoaA/NifB/PqqE/SkfB family radical SAM enzyme